jgi:hypothetical protein
VTNVVPTSPRTYHITHVNNLPAIVAQGGLVSDAVMVARGVPNAPIGMSSIKTRRLTLPITCHPGLNVGDCVPFYFCPRSIMLFVIHCANHPELTYRGGQGPIVHLEADLGAVVAWAQAQPRRWAVSLSNASAAYAQFRSNWADLPQIDWPAVASNNFAVGSTSPSGLAVKEGKQAEFLLETFFPWHLVQRIGVHSPAMIGQVLAAIGHGTHKPAVSVEPSWYY